MMFEETIKHTLASSPDNQMSTTSCLISTLVTVTDDILFEGAGYCQEPTLTVIPGIMFL